MHDCCMQLVVDFVVQHAVQQAVRQIEANGIRQLPNDFGHLLVCGIVR